MAQQPAEMDPAAEVEILMAHLRDVQGQLEQEYRARRALEARIAPLVQERDALTARLNAAEIALAAMVRSRIWRATAPLRWLLERRPR
ncbi:hypothetical protein [Rhodobacter maris]|uniref:Uncharacterized protein n=1 Tax=Rhodobacter maris TaxID=446682 RepID=A0A285SGL7_9RHOB|nr:hypothetical protein [Rhodobacter maris]SOC06911.1 hypothetical protein SAMN05877831_105177 [Rhodobacter maris]